MVFGPWLVSVYGFLLPYDCGHLFHNAQFFLLVLRFCYRVFECQRVESTMDLHKQMELLVLI